MCENIIDANNLDKKIFVNNIPTLFTHLSPIDFNIFLLKLKHEELFDMPL